MVINYDTSLEVSPSELRAIAKMLNIFAGELNIPSVMPETNFPAIGYKAQLAAEIMHGAMYKHSQDFIHHVQEMSKCMIRAAELYEHADIALGARAMSMR
jgi:hypothetical protein